MNVKYEHLFILVIVFLVISGLWFWINSFDPMEKGVVSCYGRETGFVPVLPYGADYWCKSKGSYGADQSFFLKKAFPSE